MTTIQDLIQETEKGCGKEYIYENSIDIFMICGQEKGDYCPICQAKLSTLKQCQTIEDEREKKIIEIVNQVLDKCQFEVKTHIEQFGLGDNRDIDGREKVTLLTLPMSIRKKLLKKLNPAQKEEWVKLFISKEEKVQQ